MLTEEPALTEKEWPYIMCLMFFFFFVGLEENVYCPLYVSFFLLFEISQRDYCEDLDVYLYGY